LTISFRGRRLVVQPRESVRNTRTHGPKRTVALVRFRLVRPARSMPATLSVLLRRCKLTSGYDFLSPRFVSLWPSPAQSIFMGGSRSVGGTHPCGEPSQRENGACSSGDGRCSARTVITEVWSRYRDDTGIPRSVSARGSGPVLRRQSTNPLFASDLPRPLMEVCARRRAARAHWGRAKETCCRGRVAATDRWAARTARGQEFGDGVPRAPVVKLCVAVGSSPGQRGA